jgi:hypothetical protein
MTKTKLPAWQSSIKKVWQDFCLDLGLSTKPPVLLPPAFTAPEKDALHRRLEEIMVSGASLSHESFGTQTRSAEESSAQDPAGEAALPAEPEFVNQWVPMFLNPEAPQQAGPSTAPATDSDPGREAGVKRFLKQIAAPQVEPWTLQQAPGSSYMRTPEQQQS